MRSSPKNETSPGSSAGWRPAGADGRASEARGPRDRSRRARHLADIGIEYRERAQYRGIALAERLRRCHAARPGAAKAGK
jgi:hypothetical protein